MQTIATIKNMIEDDDRISQEHAFLVQNGVYWLYHVLSTLSEILFTNIHQILLNASFRVVLNYFNFNFNFKFNYFNFFLNIFYIKRTSLKKKIARICRKAFYLDYGSMLLLYSRSVLFFYSCNLHPWNACILLQLKESSWPGPNFKFLINF